MRTAEFVNKARLIHGDKYDYSKTVYLTAHKNVIITCSIHGDFLQRPDSHIHQKQGCPKCGLANRKSPLRKTTEKFIEQIKEKWNDNYDYSTVEYKNKYTKIKYICYKHGIIEQLPSAFIKNGCPYCSGRGINKYDKDSFEKKSIEVHGNIYDYSKVQINSVFDKVIVTCKLHGDFVQRATNHINGNGCPSCAKQLKTSKAEKEICLYIKEHYDGLILENDRTILNGKEIDIYLPELKFGVEYCGLYFHSETKRGKNHHYDKWKIANEKSITLIQIYSNEYEEKESIVKSNILNYIDKNKKIFTENAQIIEVNYDDKNDFLNKNHLLGSDNSKICYGLTYNDELVSIMTFGSGRLNRKYELLRFCDKVGLSVVDGANKLLSHFRKNHEGSIISYIDKRYDSGELYYNLGFVLDGETKPSFSYFNIKNNRMYNRMRFQKHMLKDMEGYDVNLSEYEIMQLNGYDRIWNAGKFRFVME